MGVSKSTVSRALSEKGRIGKATRMKIQAYALEQGVWKKESEESKKSKTQNIAVVIPTDAYTTSVPFFQECLLGISEVAAMLDYNVLVTIGTPNDISGIQVLLNKNIVDGIILLRNMEEDRLLRYLAEIRFPIALAGTCVYDDVIQVDIDNREASERLVSLLIGQGYRQFAFIVGDTSYHVNKCRAQGCYDALDRHGVSRENQMFYMNYVNMELIDSIISDILSKKMECIICGDDVICTRIMSKLQAEGYRIPRDIFIASLYNSTSLECFSPAVTAINVSERQVGNTIGRQLINRLRGDVYKSDNKVGYEILIRKSTGKLYTL